MKVVRPDKTQAQDNVNYVVDSKAGTVSGTIQRELVDEDTSETVEDGEPADASFTAQEVQSIIAASDAAVSSVLNARAVAAAAGTQTAAASTPPAQS